MQLVEATEEGEPSHAAGALSIAMVDGLVEVLVTCDESYVDDVTAALRQLDVEVEDAWRGELMCLVEPTGARRRGRTRRRSLRPPATAFLPLRGHHRGAGSHQRG